jgi:hypothetical protein
MSAETPPAPPAIERITECWELRPGMEIETRVGGVRRFAGQVVDTHPAMGLFWAVSHVGERRLIELGEYEVYRLE